MMKHIETPFFMATVIGKIWFKYVQIMVKYGKMRF